MKTRFLFKAAIIFSILLAAAYVFDSVRIVKNAWSQLEELDAAMRPLEERYIASARALGVTSSDFEGGVAAYQSAQTFTARRDAFERVVAAANKGAIALIDPANPVQRRMGDELAGALNRRRMNEDYFRSALDNYRGIIKSNRGAAASVVMTAPVP